MDSGVVLYYKPWIIFWVIQTSGILLFIVGMVSKFSFYFSGKGRLLYKQPDYKAMLAALFREVLFQKHIIQRSLLRWSVHMLIFWGFMGLISLSAIAVALETIIPEGSVVSQYMLRGQGHNYYKLAGDLFGFMLLAGVTAAFLRRFIFRADQLHTDSSDTTTLVFLLLLVVTGFLLEAVRIGMSGPAPGLQYSFIGYRLSQLTLLQGEWARTAASVLWTLHALLTAALLAYFPHSKFMHVFSSPAEIILNASEERVRGDLYV